MNMPIPEWVKPGLWGAIVGAIVITFVGFSTGWVVTSSNAQERAEREVEKAVIASLTPICVAQFKSEPKQEQSTHLVALEKESSWERGDYIEDQGWATMPGSTDPSDEVADACASELLKLASKG